MIREREVFNMGVYKPKPKYNPIYYVVKYSHQVEPSHMMLCKLVEEESKYRFVDLRKGLIYNLTFESIEDAEVWLYTFGNVISKNIN